MSAKNKFVTLGVACASLAMVVFAQDDLDNLLEELGADKKPAAQAAPMQISMSSRASRLIWTVFIAVSLNSRRISYSIAERTVTTPL